MTQDQIAERLRACRCGHPAGFGVISALLPRLFGFQVWCGAGHGNVTFYGVQRVERAIAAWNVANTRERTVKRRARVVPRRRRPPMRAHEQPATASADRRTKRGILR
jgi:hypothetical protein